MMNTVDLEFLHRRFQYEPETGCLIRKVKAMNMPAGSPAGWRDVLGYYRVSVDGRDFLVHRIAWAMTYGEWPGHEIDHINGDPGDNRLSNLREATHAQNLRNRGARRDSKSGLRGVYQRARGDKWYSSISIGTFETKEEAADAHRRVAEFVQQEFYRPETSEDRAVVPRKGPR